MLCRRESLPDRLRPAATGRPGLRFSTATTVRPNPPHLETSAVLQFLAGLSCSSTCSSSGGAVVVAGGGGGGVI